MITRQFQLHNDLNCQDISLWLDECRPELQQHPVTLAKGPNFCHRVVWHFNTRSFETCEQNRSVYNFGRSASIRIGVLEMHADRLALLFKQFLCRQLFAFRATLKFVHKATWKRLRMTRICLCANLLYFNCPMFAHTSGTFEKFRKHQTHVVSREKGGSHDKNKRVQLE